MICFINCFKCVINQLLAHVLSNCVQNSCKQTPKHIVMHTNGSIPRYHNHMNRHSCPPGAGPPPPSAANSLRSSAPLSLRSAGNSTLFRHSIAMDSIPMSDTLVSNDDRIIVANDIMKDKSHEMSNEIVETKVSANILPIFIMEFLSLACLSSLAYFLRFTDSFGVLVRGFYCDDKTISMPFRPTFGGHSKPVMTAFSDELFYSITIGVPVIMVIVCEMLRMIAKSANNRKKKVIAAQTGCITCRIHMPLRRIFRFIGGFAYGLLVTSILTDTLKLISGRLRPHFIHVCQQIVEICRQQTIERTGIGWDNRSYVELSHIWISPDDYDDSTLCPNHTDVIREARMSFPSSTASIATFSAFFTLLYIGSAVTFKSGRIIKLWFTVSALICLLIVISGKVTTHDNHVDDVCVSLLIGIGFALYVCYTQLNRFADQFGAKRTDESYESESQMSLTEEEENQWFWKYFHIPRVNLLRRSARYFRKREPINAIPVVRCTNGSSYVNPAFEHKDTIDRDTTSRPHSAYIDSYRH